MNDARLIIPKKRSEWRLKAGKVIYTLLRYLQWFQRRKSYRLQRKPPQFRHKIFTHQTPLIRELPRVQMHYQYNKADNLRIAVKNLNGILLHPGKSFSFWFLTGRPTKRKGYKEGFAISQGKVTSRVGGGLCQLSNLIYWMTLHTDLDVIERYRHSYDVFPDINRKQPFGSGATVAYNYIDLVIQNNTTGSFQLILEVTERELKGRWLGEFKPDHRYEIKETMHKIECQPGGIYSRHNTISRDVFETGTGNKVATEEITQNHALMMYNPILPPQKSEPPSDV